MNLPPSLRSSYERGRLRDAAFDALPVVLGASCVLATGQVAQIVLAIGIVVGFFAARWRGLSWSRGALVGVAAGLLPALVAVCVSLEPGLGSGLCLAGCSVAGLLGGILLGRLASDRLALGAGLAFACATCTLGCYPLGSVALLGSVAAMLVGSVAGLLARR